MTQSPPHNPFALASKSRRRYVASITSRRDYLTRSIDEEPKRAITSESGFRPEERAALDWALLILESMHWRSVTRDDPPPQGEPLIVRSRVAGVAYAISNGAGFICACGCAAPVPEVTSWMPAPKWEEPPQEKEVTR